MSLVTKAPPAALLTLDPPNDSRVISAASNPNVPCTLAVSGASDFELRLSRIIASGYTKIKQPGKLSVQLFGKVNLPYAEPPSLNYSDWTVLGGSPGASVGGPDDPPTTMWMIMVEDLMFYYGSGKLQGQFSSNISDNPAAPWKIQPLTGIVKGIDPVCYFAVAAFFVPDSGTNVRPFPAIQLAHFQLGSQI